jgi:hypothetical protein
MASVEECEKAFYRLADILAGVDEHKRSTAVPDRTLTCRVRDLDVIFGGRFRSGELVDIRAVQRADAQIRLAVDSDDLIRLTNGDLRFARAWASGKVRVEASFRDLLRLRSLV